MRAISVRFSFCVCCVVSFILLYIILSSSYCCIRSAIFQCCKLMFRPVRESHFRYFVACFLSYSGFKYREECCLDILSFVCVDPFSCNL